MHNNVSSFIIYRSGGGIGSGDIRKMAYFESSIDPTIARAAVCNTKRAMCFSVIFKTVFIASSTGVNDFQRSFRGGSIRKRYEKYLKAFGVAFQNNPMHFARVLGRNISKYLL